MQVYVLRDIQPSITNCPFAFIGAWYILLARYYDIVFRCVNSQHIELSIFQLLILNFQFKRYSGGYSTRVPPLPIPNREVKPRHADGTAKVGE